MVRSAHNKGFTLIELLVVVTIISILTGFILLVVNPKAAQEKTRDSRRLNDLKTIQTAIDLFRFEKGVYPSSSSPDNEGESASWIALNGKTDPLSVALLTGKYVSIIPTDPASSESPNSTPCLQDANFRYNYMSDGTFYIITAQMETAASAKGYECSSLSNWNRSSCQVRNQYCVGLENEAL